MSNQEYIENYEIGLEDFKAEQTKDKLYDTVESLIETIRESKDPEAVIAAFDRDPNFHNAFNSNGLPALENLEAYLEVSNENMLIDAWRNSDFIVRTLNQARNKLADSQMTEKYLTRRVYTLPNPNEVERAMKVLQGIVDVIQDVANDANMTEEDLYNKLESAGVKWITNEKGKKITPSDVVDVYDSTCFYWSIIVNSIFAVVGISIIAGVGIPALIAAASAGAVDAALPFLTLLNGVVGAVGGTGSAISNGVLKALKHKYGKPVGERGWTVEKCQSIIDDLIKFIDKNRKIKLPKNLGFFNRLIRGDVKNAFSGQRRSKRKVLKALIVSVEKSMTILAKSFAILVS